jgi:hypothetical protein
MRAECQWTYFRSHVSLLFGQFHYVLAVCERPFTYSSLRIFLVHLALNRYTVCRTTEADSCCAGRNLSGFVYDPEVYYRVHRYWLRGAYPELRDPSPHPHVSFPPPGPSYYTQVYQVSSFSSGFPI